MDYPSGIFQKVAECVAWSEVKRAGRETAVRELSASLQSEAVGGDERAQGTCVWTSRTLALQQNPPVGLLKLTQCGPRPRPESEWRGGREPLSTPGQVLLSQAENHGFEGSSFWAVVGTCQETCGTGGRAVSRSALCCLPQRWLCVLGGFFPGSLSARAAACRPAACARDHSGGAIHVGHSMPWRLHPQGLFPAESKGVSGPGCPSVRALSSPQMRRPLAEDKAQQ